MIPPKETLEKYLEILQCIMRIQDWDIEIRYLEQYEYSQCHEGLLMAMVPDRKRNHVYIDINYQSKEFEKEDWYHCLIHELYHVVMVPMAGFIDNALGFLSDGVVNSYRDMNTVTEESVVDKLASIFVGIYPLESLEEGIEEEGDDDKDSQ